MSRRLDDLHPDLKPKAFELLARCTEAGIPVMIVDTLRTWDEHQQNLKNGTSWTKVSKHLPDPTTGKSKAIDIAPYWDYKLYGADKLQWDTNDPVWGKIGAIGKALGLKWGGDWQKKDMGHFEL